MGIAGLVGGKGAKYVNIRPLCFRGTCLLRPPLLLSTYAHVLVKLPIRKTSWTVPPRKNISWPCITRCLGRYHYIVICSILFNSVLSGGFRIYSVNTYSDVSMLSVTLTQWRFYCVMLCIRGTNHGPVSVCLSVTSRCSTKTVKRRITQTTPHDSPGTLVFWRQRSPRNSTGVTPYGAPNAGGVGQNRRRIYAAII